MRFILLAFALIGVALYLSNPQTFGISQGFQLSGGDRIARRGAPLNFSKIGDFGAEMFDFFTDDPARDGLLEMASNESEGTQAFSAVKVAPSYAAQLTAIAAALHSTPEATAAEMFSATQACLPAETPDPMINYFSGLVQVVAQTAQFPQAEQTAEFKRLSAPLTEALIAWLQFMPEEQRAAQTAVLQAWADRPEALVACHRAWLDLE